MKIREIYQKQKDFFDTNCTKDIDFRIAQLKHFKALLKAHEKQMYEAIDQDFGKSEFETYMSELSLIYREINLFVRNSRKWACRQKVPTHFSNFPAKSYIIPEPLGNSLVIGAWNYPYQLSLIPALSSLAAGNTVILKPSELPIQTSKILAKIINENFSMGYFHVIEGGIKETSDILQYSFDKIFFTGSTAVGKIVYESAAKHLTPVTLELGGKSPTFVLKDSDIDIAVKRIVWAKFLNAGQTCVAPDYVLVDQAIEATFLEALKNRIKDQYSVHDINDHYLKIINHQHFDRLVSLIDTTKVFYGGEVFRENRWIAPTVLRDVHFDDKVMQDEIFGPILPVLAFHDLNDIIKKVKQRPKPLACYIYSKDQKMIDRLLKEISFGGGAINDSLLHLTNTSLPFGGVGLSGMGCYHGKAGFDTFSHHKSILDKSLFFDASLKYPPYTKTKRKIMKWLLER